MTNFSTFLSLRIEAKGVCSLVFFKIIDTSIGSDKYRRFLHIWGFLPILTPKCLSLCIPFSRISSTIAKFVCYVES